MSSNLATIESIRYDLNLSKNEIASVLPPQITIDKFVRVVVTACQMMPELMTCERRSLLASTMKCATDGLIPDGREAAIIPFGGKAQYLPMVGGLLKKIRQSGELLSISANAVYSKDEFDYELGDDEHIKHRPCLDEDRGVFKCVYAVAKTKDGGIYREVMGRVEVEKVRAVSKAKMGPGWTQWYDEMAKKSVIKRMSKRMPSSTDVEDFIHKDNEDEIDETKFGKQTATVLPEAGTPTDPPIQTTTNKVKEEMRKTRAAAKPTSGEPAAAAATTTAPATTQSAATTVFPQATKAPPEPQQELTVDATVAPAATEAAPKAEAEKPAKATKAQKTAATPAQPATQAAAPKDNPPPAVDDSGAPPADQLPGEENVSAEGEIVTEKKIIRDFKVGGPKIPTPETVYMCTDGMLDKYYIKSLNLAKKLSQLGKTDNAAEIEFYTSAEKEMIIVAAEKAPEEAATFSAGDPENPLQ